MDRDEWIGKFSELTGVRAPTPEEVEAILNRTEAESHGVRSLIHALVDSQLFQIK